MQMSTYTSETCIRTRRKKKSKIGFIQPAKFKNFRYFFYQSSYIATALTSVAQLRRAFAAKILLYNQTAGNFKGNATEMSFHAATLKDNTKF